MTSFPADALFPFIVNLRLCCLFTARIAARFEFHRHFMFVFSTRLIGIRHFGLCLFFFIFALTFSSARSRGPGQSWIQNSDFFYQTKTNKHFNDEVNAADYWNAAVFIVCLFFWCPFWYQQLKLPLKWIDFYLNGGKNKKRITHDEVFFESSSNRQNRVNIPSRFKFDWMKKRKKIFYNSYLLYCFDLFAVKEYFVRLIPW